jgi:predicted O-methyltransferase YrrM
MQNIQIEPTIKELYKDSKNDYLRMMRGAAKSIFRPMQPADFKDAYLAISEEQGKDLVKMIKENNIKYIVEFGTSFGISTLFLAQGAIATGGKIITTELIESKAQKALENFKRAGVNHLIELRIGDAMNTLKNHSEPIDLLLLDGWKDLYLLLFQMLEPNFHSNTIVYVDNADMADSRSFLNTVAQNSKYQLHYQHSGKVAIIRLK